MKKYICPFCNTGYDSSDKLIHCVNSCYNAMVEHDEFEKSRRLEEERKASEVEIKEARAAAAKATSRVYELEQKYRDKYPSTRFLFKDFPFAYLF